MSSVINYAYFFAWHSVSSKLGRSFPRKQCQNSPQSKDPRHDKNFLQRQILLGLYIPLLVKEEAKFLVLVSGGAVLTRYCSHVILDDWDFH